MIEFLKLTEDQRRGIMGVIDYTQGIPEKALEKDWWVTLTLKALFTCEYSKFIVFKGGTSLSKCWKLIERFSEDIDIALNSEAFGISYTINPGKNYVTNLKKKSCAFISDELRNSLEKQLLSFGVPKELFSIEAADVDPKMPDKDPQILFLKYKSLYETNNYLADQVKIEVSARSQNEPSKRVSINSFIGSSQFAAEYTYKEEPIELTAVEPQRTFLEKAFLLHEEFVKPDKTKIRAERMSRHLYDLERMMDHETGTKALIDQELYESIVLHRENYSRLGWVDYKTLHRDSINFLPDEDTLKLYEKDYQSMREEMIYGAAPEFSELIKRIKRLNNRFRTNPAPPKTIKVQPEFPPYSFFKNEDEQKLDTWRIEVDEKYRIFRLNSIIINPIEARFDVDFTIRIESSSDDYEMYFDCAGMIYIPRHKNYIFFREGQDYYVDIPLSRGRNWITINVYAEKKFLEFDMKLNCEYIS